ncbi:tRNA-dihydrouridine synthase family protein [Pseudobacteriovorax antillogorgiicola]|uniref:tRNA-U20a,U20b-dihydrouridine synthase n=1 Tax=Pseudobacteriovorax antillogorgiicola TaxID=1513793 RepID=A0A1Y6C340_9BACT|nr:tRNA-dihydrouridine synthase family protein [Pseudobacteriovorax antillogorgiicola]TCS49809.1 tRNA-U20a,U20b-dihydrouridine synthase [Pseudobacteriovorax antillogorgiicola]SMF43099.1 tRNA-U20a,U20b-dihydrouridine synthase [Pseudobacteriovorax antillogorgiicola]
MAKPDTLYLAPLLGITDACFRQCFTKHFSGFDRAIAPFVKTLSGGRWKESKVLDLDPRFNQALPVVPQIISNNTEDFIALANHLITLGYKSINLNLGCPVPMAAGRGRGAGLLPHQDFLREFLEQIIERICVPLSIKTRIGFQEPDELEALVEMLNQLPLETVAIHPRTAKALYSGEVDLDRFDRIVNKLNQRIIYSGDITSYEDYKALKKRYPQIQDWMIGRGAVRNPYLVETIRQCGRDVFRVPFKPFYEDLFEAYLIRGFTRQQCLDKLKAIWFYQANPTLIQRSQYKLAKKTRQLDEFLNLVPLLETGQ